MNEVIKAIQDRRTIRKFRRQPVPKDKVETVLEAGRWAPSFSNAQPWRFIVVQEEETKRRLSEEAARSVYYKGIMEAPVTIVVCADLEAEPQHWTEAGWLAHQNMALAAHSLGLGCSWVHIAGTKSEEPIKKVLGIPKRMRVSSLMPMGFPDESPKGHRKPLQEIVSYERFGR